MEQHREAASDSSEVVSRPVAADWLQLRRAADHRARQSTIQLIDRVGRWLREGLGDNGTAAVIDLGAGTGSNQAWLAPRLQVPQQWILVDHDAGLLDSNTAAENQHVVDTRRVIGSVDQLPALMPTDAPALVTCAALLDLLDRREAALIAETIASFDAAAVLSLSVTGGVCLTPDDPLDGAVSAAFDAHQRRADLLGPDAAELVAEHLRERGADVELVQTDWVLDDAQPEFVERYLTDRVQAAAEQDPALAAEAHQWLQRRLMQLRQGRLTLRVGHLDVVSLPASSAPAA